MRARIIKSILNTGSVARDYIQLVCSPKQSADTKTVVDETREGATRILEAFRNSQRLRESDYILTGKRVIAAMNEQLRQYRSAAEQFANWVTRGSYVSIRGEDRRFTVLKILWDRQAIAVRSDEGQDYVVPFKIIGPWPVEADDEQHRSGERK